MMTMITVINMVMMLMMTVICFTQTCEQGVLLQPRNSRSLYLLGNAQLSRYDNELNDKDSAKTLEEAEQSFRTSLDLEGKPSSGNDVPGSIQGQRWWKKRQAQNESKPSTSSPEKASVPNNAKSNKRLSPTKGSATATRGRGKLMQTLSW